MSVILENEKKELWEKFVETKKSLYVNKSKKSSYYETLLQKVSTPEQSVLYSTECIEELRELKDKLDQVGIDFIIVTISSTGERGKLYKSNLKC